MEFNLALRDCEECIKLDPTFSKNLSICLLLLSIRTAHFFFCIHWGLQSLQQAGPFGDFELELCRKTPGIDLGRTSDLLTSLIAS